MTEPEALDLAMRGLNAALQRDSASGNGIDVLVITKEGMKKLVDKDVTPKVI